MHPRRPYARCCRFRQFLKASLRESSRGQKLGSLVATCCCTGPPTRPQGRCVEVGTPNIYISISARTTTAKVPAASMATPAGPLNDADVPRPSALPLSLGGPPLRVALPAIVVTFHAANRAAYEIFCVRVALPLDVAVTLGVLAGAALRV